MRKVTEPVSSKELHAESWGPHFHHLCGLLGLWRQWCSLRNSCKIRVLVLLCCLKTSRQTFSDSVPRNEMDDPGIGSQGLSHGEVSSGGLSRGQSPEDLSIIHPGISHLRTRHARISYLGYQSSPRRLVIQGIGHQESNVTHGCYLVTFTEDQATGG